MFEDPVLGGTVNLGDSLLLPTAHTQQSEPSAGLFLDEETDSLFRYRSRIIRLFDWLTPTPALHLALTCILGKKPDQTTSGGSLGRILTTSNLSGKCRLPSTHIALIYIRGKRLSAVSCHCFKHIWAFLCFAVGYRTTLTSFCR